MVVSARKYQCLAEITTDRFKKGRPDLFIKNMEMPSFHIECKYELKRKTLDYVPIETTKLQKLCLHNLRDYGALAFISVCVEFDKNTKRVYNVYDIDAERLNLDQHYFEPLTKEKGKLIWPVLPMLKIAISSLE